MTLIRTLKGSPAIPMAVSVSMGASHCSRPPRCGPQGFADRDAGADGGDHQRLRGLVEQRLQREPVQSRAGERRFPPWRSRARPVALQPEQALRRGECECVDSVKRTERHHIAEAENHPPGHRMDESIGDGEQAVERANEQRVQSLLHIVAGLG